MPIRFEATAPYTAASAYLPAALAREISGPLRDAAAEDLCEYDFDLDS